MGKRKTKNVKIKGYVKSVHFIERQGERNITDKQVLSILDKGTSLENEDGYIVFRWQEFTLVADPWEELLITVHAEGHDSQGAKVISFQEAKKIKRNMKEMKKDPSDFNQIATVNDFYLEMHRQRVNAFSEEDIEREGEVIDLEDYLNRKRSA